jgi:hypothetical protein
MRFVRTETTRTDTGALAEVYIHIDTPSINVSPTDPLIEVDVEGESRLLLGSALAMMLSFNRDQSRRTQLGHDCGVFALACELNQPLEETRFGPGHTRATCTNYSIRYEEPDGFMAEPDLEAGQIALTTDSIPTDPGFLSAKSDLHFMVRASGRDGENPLYLSKLGSVGPVVLHELTDLSEFYPAQTVGQASGFQIIPAPS